MPTQEKIEIVKNLAQKLTESKSLVFTNYQGLSTAQLEQLRRRIEEAGGAFVITKNTLLQLALQKTTYHLPLTTYHLTGQTATLFAFEDEVAPIKALAEFIKEWELPKIKAGFLQNEFISAEKVKELAKLPERSVLLAQLVAQTQSPTARLVYSLKANLNRLVYTLDATKKHMLS